MGLGIGLEMGLELKLRLELELGLRPILCIGELIIWAVSLLGFLERGPLFLEGREREGRREARERECWREDLLLEGAGGGLGRG